MTSSAEFGLIPILIILAIILLFFIGPLIIVRNMARNRNRDAALWLVVSFLLSPILVMIILALAGDKYSRDDED